jgi:hypothetical protein
LIPQALALCDKVGSFCRRKRTVIGTRLKRAGMHWTVKGANTIIALQQT